MQHKQHFHGISSRFYPYQILANGIYSHLNNYATPIIQVSYECHLSFTNLSSRNARLHTRFSEVGANVIGVGEGPVGSIPPKVRKYLADYIQVPRLFDEQSLITHTYCSMQKQSH